MKNNIKPESVKILKDILLSARTEATILPPHRVDYATPQVTILIAHGKDASSEWHMPLEDAVALGIVETPEGFDENTYNFKRLRQRMLNPR